MSLDIKVRRKNLPPPIKVQLQPPVKPPAQNINTEELPKSQPLRQMKKNKKHSYGWWVLFIILILLFVGVIYIIWHEQTKQTEKITTKKEQSAGIVSTFVPENKTTENIQLPTEPEQFSREAINIATSDFTDKLFLYKQQVSTSSAENINMTVADVYATAQLTLATLQRQYIFLQQSFEQVSVTSSVKIYKEQIDDYIQKVQGEFNIISTLIELESEISFSPEILVSLEKLDQYFQEIKNLIQVIDEELNPDLELELITGEIISTTTVSTSTEI